MTPHRKAKLIVVLNFVTLLGTMVIVVLLFRIISSAANQSTKTNDSIIASQKATEKELRCLASFFSQANRQVLRISNLETCEVVHTDTGQTEILPLSASPFTGDNETSPAVPSSDKQTSTENTKPTPAAGDQTTSQTPAASQTTPQVQAQEEVIVPPVEVLGIPLCVPFSGLCIR